MARVAEFGEVGPVLDRHIDMVGKILADAGKIDNRRNAMIAQMFHRTDAGQHQQLWRAERPLTENDFPTRRNHLSGDCLDGVCPPVFNTDPRHLAIC